MANSPGSFNRPNYRKSGPPTNNIRKNDRIRAREMRLIDPDGKMLGVVSKEDALQAAKQYGLDLVEISGNANPPVCRIMDFGKYLYELSKKGKDKVQHAVKMKEVKFRVRIEQHDYMTKLRHAEEFLFKGNKVKLTLMFRGREMEHKQLGFEVINRAIADLTHVAQSEGEARLAGRNINLVLIPLPTGKRKLKFSKHDDPPTADVDDDSSEDDSED
jgi:translation initiation factor IF-3